MWWGVNTETNVFYFKAGDKTEALAIASRDFGSSNLVGMLPLVLGEFSMNAGHDYCLDDYNFHSIKEEGVMTLLKENLNGTSVQGTCPSCHRIVFETTLTLDDNFSMNFTCPHCQAILFLDGPGRGYNRDVMNFALVDNV